jgi:predicted dehydrogenase
MSVPTLWNALSGPAARDAGRPPVPRSAQDLAEVARATGQGKRVGLIGCGWYGKCDLLRLIQVADIQVVSLCDVDRRMLGGAIDVVAQRQASRQKPRGFSDYRQMLAERDLDLVLIATPDHWHALPMIEACQAGADVYVQKPVGIDVLEGEAMVQVARQTGRVVQVGTQRRSTPHLINAKQQVIDAGLLGKVGHAEVYCYYHMRSRDVAPPTDVPEYLDFDFWTGPAPLLPYRSLMHPRSWRAFMEFGNGIVGDMCVHMLDTVRWLLNLDWPQQVHSLGGVHVEQGMNANITDCQTASFQFPDLSVVWQHRSWGAPVDPRYPWGATLFGDKGTLKVSVHRWDFEPYGGGQPLSGQVQLELDRYPEDEREPDLEQHVAPAIRRHMQDFLAATADRSRPVADILQGHISSAACVLANLSVELGRSLVYDPHTRTIPCDTEATARLARSYRAPWLHPQALLAANP